jgi:hypothetical protein
LTKGRRPYALIKVKIGQWPSLNRLVAYFGLPDLNKNLHADTN